MRDSDEAGLLGELRGVLGGLDPVPAGVREAAVMAGSLLGVRWERVELAQVAVPLVRGAARVWAREPDITIRVGDEVTGVVAPELGVTRVEAQGAAGGARYAVDAGGSFGGPVVGGRVRFVLHRACGVALVTSWLG
ncbi:hypothetical protein L6E12_00235 [Actinokineospora sp. PR83]|uniref:hypothetical protein n=1 Tax=Actinokineospora sp. PR83 TaxID=2884908 RepID=UPI001F3435A3|nr:hypothetical protein [Actinokineospora sp. PR83]MCG8914226.1 hypothetical protein [Actinokineospora sp. PR83]